jgi:RecB family endonuclease NucS
MGFDSNYVFRGFGEANSGVREISQEMFENLRAEFIRTAEIAEERLVRRAGSVTRGGSGEGPEHLALKTQIAADPSGVLGEGGLTLWNVEWPFIETGDRIDIVLKDALGRFVAVEVEVDCDECERTGPLQCAKYRAMLSYFFNRPVEEVRCILVAHSIHDDLAARCTRYRIETRVVPRPALLAQTARA